MNLSITNPKIKPARAQSPALGLKNKPSIDDATPASDSRAIGQDLAVQALPQEEKAIQVLNSVANIGRRLGSKVLNFLGFAGASLTALTFIFGFKVISIIFAAPTVGALFLANHFKRTAQKQDDEIGLLSDPLKIIEKAKNDSLFLESDFNKVLAAMVRVGEFKNTDPRKTEALADLAVVAKKVSVKSLELSSVDKTNHQLIDLRKFLDIYRAINPDQSISVTDNNEN